MVKAVRSTLSDDAHADTTGIGHLVLMGRHNCNVLLHRFHLYYPKPSGDRIEHTAKEQRHQSRRHDYDIVRHAEVGRRQVQQ